MALIYYLQKWISLGVNVESHIRKHMGLHMGSGSGNLGQKSPIIKPTERYEIHIFLCFPMVFHCFPIGFRQ